MTELKLPRPLTFVFSAGAARAPVQVEMLRATRAAGIHPYFVVGTSSGGVNAAVYAADPNHALVNLELLRRAVAADTSLSTTWRGAVRGVAGNQSSRTASMLTKHLTAAIGDRDFAELAIPLALVATDLDTGLPVVLDSGSVRQALLAAAAFRSCYPRLLAEINS